MWGQKGVRGGLFEPSWGQKRGQEKVPHTDKKGSRQAPSFFSFAFVLACASLVNAFAWGGEILWHSVAELFNGFSYFLSDLKMGLIGSGFALNILPAQLFFGLSGAKEVCSQLRAAHVVKNVFLWLQTTALSDILCFQTAI